MLLASSWDTLSGLLTIGFCRMVLALALETQLLMQQPWKKINETIFKVKNEVKELIKVAQDKHLEAELR